MSTPRRRRAFGHDGTDAERRRGRRYRRGSIGARWARPRSGRTEPREGGGERRRRRGRWWPWRCDRTRRHRRVVSSSFLRHRASSDERGVHPAIRHRPESPSRGPTGAHTGAHGERRSIIRKTEESDEAEEERRGRPRRRQPRRPTRGSTTRRGTQEQTQEQGIRQEEHKGHRRSARQLVEDDHAVR